MPQDWQAFMNTLGFISFWSTIFHLLAYMGLLISTWGILDKRRQPYLFFIGVSLLWSFAVFVNNPVFVAAQIIIAVASLMRVLAVNDAPKVISFLTALIVIGALRRGDFDEPSVLPGVLAVLGLAFGVVFAPRIAGSILFALGGSLMAYYSYMEWFLPFFLLNIPFTLAALWEIGKYFFSKKSV